MWLYLGVHVVRLFFVVFFFNDTATTEIYTLSLHDALPIWFRWNITRKFATIIIYNIGEKENSSEFFSTKDYKISYFETEPKLTFQPNTSFRMSLMFKYTEKRNKLITEYSGDEKLNSQKISAEIKRNIF